MEKYTVRSGRVCIPSYHLIRIGKSCKFSRSYITLPPGAQSYSRQLGEDMVIPTLHYSQRSVDTVVCDDTPTILSASTTGIRQVWENGDTSPAKTVTKSETYWVQSFNNCNVHTDTFKVTGSNCSCIVSLPNAFTPDNDGRNDRFRALGSDIVELTLRIYNRYGECVFQSFDVNDAWDGKFRGKDCTIGSYFYFLRARCIKGQDVFSKGAKLALSSFLTVSLACFS